MSVLFNSVLIESTAVDSMRTELNKTDMMGEVVIGEGELDKAPMLFIGEKLGSLNGPEIDIAVDPLVDQLLYQFQDHLMNLVFLQ